MDLTTRIKTLQQRAIESNPTGGLENILDTFAFLIIEDFRELTASKCNKVPFIQAKIFKNFDTEIVKDYYEDS